MNVPAYIDITRTVFPVLAVQAQDPGEAARPDFFGTAFAIAPGVFMTAEHVVRAALSAGQLAIGGPVNEGGESIGTAVVTDVETWPGHDVAILFCDVTNVTILNIWMVERIQLHTDLKSFGFPHAVTSTPEGDRFNVVFRGYKGYVITTRGFERLPGAPAVYEVSSAFPQGMSGAPVLLDKDNTLVVAGMVLGIDTVTYGDVPQNVGIAMVADEITSLKSEKLKGTIAAKLGFLGAALGLVLP